MLITIVPPTILWLYLRPTLQDGTHAWHTWVAKNLKQIGHRLRRKPNKMIVLLKEQKNKMIPKDIWLYF